MLATPQDAGRFGYDLEVVTPYLTRADARVRSYLCGRASAVAALTTPPPALVELTLSVAHRMANTSEQVVTGVTSEQSGQQQVSWGAQAYAGTSDLTDAEKTRLDRLFPFTVRSVDIVQ